MKRSLIATTLLSLFAASAVNAAEPTATETAELRKIIAEQDKILKDLERRLDETDQRVEATADAVDSSSAGSDSNAVTIGGYGELHYNNLTDNNKSGADAEKKEMDFHRFVLFFGKEFNSTTRFFSEFELEHALSGDGDDKPGEVELEQAYIEHDINDQFTTQLGVFLVPVGLMNETHEPPTFYGVERNNVEKNIIPTTWWEGGANLNYKPAAGWSIDTAVHSGLYVNDSFLIRKGRQKIAEAEAEALAFTGRVSYTAIPGLQLAASMQYQEDITQGGVTKDGTTVDEASATLLTAHAVYQINNFTIKALYATWDIDGDEAARMGRDEQTGYYIEPSYRFNEKVGVFARYNVWDNNAGNDLDTETEQVSFGVNYYLHENVVLKADYEIASGGTATKDGLGSEDVDVDGFNLGVGYQF
ncbi:porin [Thalassomonas sp. M1454]|uniref:porin n=1 Tax=Thalassomonas sp. M1454 TaxID=2594477 RepID=UPI001180D50B|nr:porin [Thalassomonas sp. M1454]TRX58056.1 porin [Thalassomonas sp. M1454]